MRKKRLLVFSSMLVLLSSTFAVFHAEETGKRLSVWETLMQQGRQRDSGRGVGGNGSEMDADGLSVTDPDCDFFSGQHDKVASVGMRESFRAQWRSRIPKGRPSLRNSLTVRVASQLPYQPRAEEGKFDDFDPGIQNPENVNYSNTVDRHLFAEMIKYGVPPAPPTNDFEFIRRVTLDLTGRIPTVGRLISFVNDQDPNKRARLIDELLASPEWVDKWAMYFGDHLKNTERNINVRLYDRGVRAFESWIRTNLSNNVPYDQMVRDLLSTQGTNSFSEGPVNWWASGQMAMGVTQDHFDLQTARAADQFLGLSHVNCLLCHDGAGHLDTLSLWGKDQKRGELWQLASFVSRTEMRRTRIEIGESSQNYWGIRENTGRRYDKDYQLNTTSGNRPPRVPAVIGLPNEDEDREGPVTVPPVYPFSGRGPGPGENYRAALARELTSDFQFARATVNYMWKEFFGIGIVDPPNMFDLARLDPDNPPPAPWTLQPSHPRLLEELAQDFINSGYNLKTLMRQIANSRAYQLSSRYVGGWNGNWERLFARKLVRRLWAEEIHDAIALSSNQIPSYDLGSVYGTRRFAMQFPDTRNTGGSSRSFLDEFGRGNRDDELRDNQSTIPQALSMMNHRLITDRARGRGSDSSDGLLQASLRLSDDNALIDNMFLYVLSRLPSGMERDMALSMLRSGERRPKAEELLWSLYNKVDFIFNY